MSLSREGSFVLALVGLALFLTGCGGNPASGRESSNSSESPALEGRLVLTGSSTMAPLLGEIGKRFESLHPGVRIDVQTGGSSRGIRDAQSGAADLGMSSRDLTADEAVGMFTRSMALDGVAFVVHAKNSVQELSKAQLRGIYSGAIRDWEEVGGSPGPIVVINRAAGRSELELVGEYLALATPDMYADSIAGENQHGLRSVAGNPNAIIYISVGTSSYEAAEGAAIRLLPLEGVEATLATVGSGRYPLARPLVLVWRESSTESLATRFVDFSVSDEVSDLVVSQSFVPVEG